MGNKKNIVYLILGLGLGIIITNILHSAYPRVEFTDLDDDTIIEQARDLGMVLIKENIKVEKGEDEPKDKELEETLEKLEEAIKRLEDAEKTETDELEEDSGEAEKDDLGKTEEEKEVVIESGLNLTEVASRLYDGGVIENKDEFADYVRSNNLSRKIVSGRYKFKKDSSYSEIIKLLTGVSPRNN